MLRLMRYPQRVLLHKQQKRPRTLLAILKYVAAERPTDRQLRYSNRPIRCSTQLSRYYGRYHEHSDGSAGRLVGLQAEARLMRGDQVLRGQRCGQAVALRVGLSASGF